MDLILSFVMLFTSLFADVSSHNPKNTNVVEQYNHRMLTSKYKYNMQYQHHELSLVEDENPEIDVQLSSDNVVYIWHNENLGFLGHGNVKIINSSSKRLDKIGLVRLDSWLNKNSKYIKNLFLEPKNVFSDNSKLEKIRLVLEKYRDINSITKIESFHASDLDYFKKYNYKTYMLFSSDIKTLRDNLSLYKRNYDGILVSRYIFDAPNGKQIQDYLLKNWHKDFYLWTVVNNSQENQAIDWLIANKNKFRHVGYLSENKDFNEYLKERVIDFVQSLNINERKKDRVVEELYKQSSHHDYSSVSEIDKFLFKFYKENIEKI